MQVYNQFIEFCNSLLKYVNTQYLVYGALISLAFFLVWTVLATISSSIRRFYIRCHKLEKYLKKNKVGFENIESIDKMCRKVSRGFFFGWTKFKRSKGKKPSDYLTKRDVLDAEISDGMLNHGKTLMKTYVGITTALIFILNLAYLGKDLSFTFNILVEAMFLPFVYYVVMMLMYFVSNLIKQEIYIIATAHFYALVDNLDRCFDTDEDVINSPIQNNINVVVDNKNDLVETSQNELEIQESENQTDELQEQVEVDETIEESVDENEIDSIQTENESFENNDVLDENQDEETNVDLQDDSETTEKSAPMISLEQFKINDETFESQDDANNDIEIANEEIIQTEEPAVSEEEPTEDIHIARNWEAEDNLDQFDVFKKKNINVDKYINEIPKEEEHATPFIDVNAEVAPIDEYSVNNEIIDENNFDIEKNHPLDEFENVENIEVKQENNESIFDFDEKSTNLEEDLQKEEVDDTQELNPEVEDDVEPLEEDDFNFDNLVENNNDEVTEENFDEETTEIGEDNLDSLNDENQDFDNFEQNLESEDNNEAINPDEFDFFAEPEKEVVDVDIFDNENNEEAINDFKSQIEDNLNESNKEIDSKLEHKTEDLDLSSLVGEFKQNYHNNDETLEESTEENNNQTENIDEHDAISNSQTKEIFDKINDLEQLIHSAIGKNEIIEEKPLNKTKRARKGKKIMTDDNLKKTRGRPKMQAIDENLVISNEQEFEEILSRAEKLMRKSEEGLSASQSKRIEKELKIMMDAMNKYKEGER